MFSIFVSYFNKFIETTNVSKELKLEDFNPVYKRMIGIKKKTIARFYLLYLKYLNVVFKMKFTKMLTI